MLGRSKSRHQIKEKRRLRGASLFRIGVWYAYEEPPEAVPFKVVPKAALPC